MKTAVLCFVLSFVVAINANGAELYIVGGGNVRITDYPYQAMVQFGNFKCGGSIISEEYILTAAHCVHNVDVDTIQVRIGSRHSGKGGQTYSVSETFVHPLYNASIFDYDVAVIKTSKNMKIDNRTTKAVTLADSGNFLRPGDYIKSSGWGRIWENGPTSKSLKAVTLPVISPEKCKAAFKGTSSLYTSRMMCAGVREGGKDSCIGDSGGPAVHKETKVQYGIVSWGRGCARSRFPGVYTAVPAVRDWIKQVTGI